MRIYFFPVQKMFLKCACAAYAASGDTKVHFLVIAAPRPSGSPDLDSIQTGTFRGALFLTRQDGDKAIYCTTKPLTQRGYPVIWKLH